MFYMTVNRKNLWASIIAITMFLSLFATRVDATALIQEGALPAAAPEKLGIFDQADYRESTLSYENGRYFFVTGDSTYNNGAPVYIHFDGQTGTVVSADLADTENVFAAIVIRLADTNGDGAFEFTTQLAQANCTMFIDDGTYFDTAAANSTHLSAANLALIGMNAGNVILKRQPYLKRETATGTITPYLEQQAINSPGMIYQNLIFDASTPWGNAGLITNTAVTATAANQWSTNGGTSWTQSGTVVAANRGDSFFNIPSGNRDFLMKNCEIRNIGTAVSQTTGNFAINVAQGNTGQINLEDITIANCKGADSGVDLVGNYRLVNLHPATNVNIKNMTFMKGADGNLREPIWAEYPSTTSIATLQSTDHRFAGTLEAIGYELGDVHTTGAKTFDRLVISSYAYDNITLPEGYRYAVFNKGTETGLSSPLSGQGQSGHIYLYKSLDDFVQLWGSTANSQQVVYDLADNSWLVRPEEAGKNNATIDQQLEAIDMVLRRLAQPQSTSSINANGRNLETDAYIKLVANSAGEIPSFTVPSFAADHVHIKATPFDGIGHLNPAEDYLFNDAVVSDNTANDTLIPFAAGGTIENNAGTALTLYNIDFHEKANYTLHEAIAGLTMDNRTDPPLDISDIAPKVSNAVNATFVKCRFTTLIQDVALSVDPVLDSDTSNDDDTSEFSISALVGTTIGAPALTVSEAYTNTGSGTEHVVTPTNTFFADDTDTATHTQPQHITWNLTQWDTTANSWVASDGTVATVDGTGNLTVVGMGKVKLLATAEDIYNDGEIPYPQAFYILDITLLSEEGDIKLIKKDVDTEALLAGAVFGVYRTSDDVKVDELTTNTDGEAFSISLPVGAYYLQEITAPVDYKLSTAKYDVVVATNETETVTATNEKDITPPTPDPEDGQILLIKKDADTDAPLAGAVFRMYRSADHVKVDELTTDANGEAYSVFLPVGAYYLQEITAPDGYKASTATHDTVVTAGDITEVTITNERKDAPPIPDPENGQILLIKRDADTDAFLAGAVFEVYRTSDDVKVDELTTNAAGEVYSVSLAPGAYYLTEITAPDGYKASDATHDVVVVVDETATMTVTNEKEDTPPPPEPESGQILLIKKDADTNAPLAGAVFEVYRASDDTKVDELTTDTNGTAQSASLPVGAYYLKEITAPEGYKASDATHDVTVVADIVTELIVTNKKNDVPPIPDPENGQILLTKKEADTDILLAGAVFGVYRASDHTKVDELTTDISGKAHSVSLPVGDYYLKEITAPEGYKASDATYDVAVVADVTTEITVTNEKKDVPPTPEPKTGQILLIKKDADTKALLADAVFGVYRTSDDVKVGELTTAANGEACSAFLPTGTYYLKELTAPKGYTLSTVKHNVTVTAAKVTKLEVTNQRSKTNGKVPKNTPKTGDTSSWLFLVLFALSATLCYATLHYRYKKKHLAN